MKKIICTCALLMSMAAAFPQDILDGQANVSSLNVATSNGSLLVAMDIDVSGVKVKSNNEVTLTPIITDEDSLEENMVPIRIMGRKRYYYCLRNHTLSNDGYEYRAKKVKVVSYSTQIPYAEWMDNSVIELENSLCGCRCKLLANGSDLLYKRMKFEPEFVYVTPEANAEKTSSLEGSAFIDFPVNKTEIYPDYHNNTVELGKIRATIDSVKNDKDITITSLWLKGYASPEGTYSHNTDLAKGRTAALKGYVQKLYSFDDYIIETDYEAEDWAGLRNYVEKSNLENKEGILAIIDDDSIDPDPKEAKIKKTYNKDYKFLLANSYPWLRHTDYRVNYTIRSFTDVNEIREIMRTQPQKLGLNEFYLLAQNCEPGSDEYAEVFETAVRMFPGDETANLNAANVEMSRNDYTTASQHLAKAGNRGEAEYARGVLAMLNKDYESARTYLESAKSKGIMEADACIEYLDNIK